MPAATPGPASAETPASDREPPTDKADETTDNAVKSGDDYRREQIEETQGANRQGFFGRIADDISSQLSASWLGADGILGGDPISDLGDQWRAFNERQRVLSRLDLGMAYTALYQKATSGSDGTSGAAGDYDFIGSWHLVGLEGRTAGRFGFQVEFRHNFGGSTPNELNESIGSIVPTARGFNDAGLAFKQFWWEQEFARGRVQIRIGKISQRDFFSTGRFQSSNFFFLNQALAASLAVPFPDTGAGATIFAFPFDYLYVGLGAGATAPDVNRIEFDRLLDGEIFTALEFGVLTDFDGLGSGTYRFTFSNTDGSAENETPSGRAFAFSADQAIGENFTVFMRYAASDATGLTAIQNIITGGFAIHEPFHTAGGLFGFGVAWVEPDDKSLRTELIIENFYRIQVTRTMQITPDLQLILDPASTFGEDIVAVFGLRMRIQY